MQNVTFISNSDFKYLSPLKREHLKQDYHNYLYINGIRHYYLQDVASYYFNKHLQEIQATCLEPIAVYMNDKLGKSLGLLKETTSESLF